MATLYTSPTFPAPLLGPPPLPPSQTVQVNSDGTISLDPTTPPKQSIFESDFEHINEDSPVLSVQHIQAHETIQTTFPMGVIDIHNGTDQAIRVSIQ